MEARDEAGVTIAFFRQNSVSFILKALEHVGTHVRHDPHVDDHVGAVGDFYADLGERGIKRSHAKRDHIHRPAFHAAGEFLLERGAHFLGVRPVVGGSGFVGTLGADERAVFDAGDIGWRRAGEEGIRAELRVEAGEGTFLDHHRGQAIPLFLRAVAPFNGVRRAECDHFLDPRLECFMGGVCFVLHCGFIQGVIARIGNAMRKTDTHLIKNADALRRPGFSRRGLQLCLATFKLLNF